MTWLQLVMMMDGSLAIVTGLWLVVWRSNNIYFFYMGHCFCIVTFLFMRHWHVMFSTGLCSCAHVTVKDVAINAEINCTLHERVTKDMLHVPLIHLSELCCFCVQRCLSCMTTYPSWHTRTLWTAANSQQPTASVTFLAEWPWQSQLVNAVYCQNLARRADTLWWQKAPFCVETDGACSNHFASNRFDTDAVTHITRMQLGNWCSSATGEPAPLLLKGGLTWKPPAVSEQFLMTVTVMLMCWNVPGGVLASTRLLLQFWRCLQTCYPDCLRYTDTRYSHAWVHTLAQSHTQFN